MTLEDEARDVVDIFSAVSEAFMNERGKDFALRRQDAVVAMTAALIQARATDRLTVAVAKLEETIFRARE